MKYYMVLSAALMTATAMHGADVTMKLTASQYDNSGLPKNYPSIQVQPQAAQMNIQPAQNILHNVAAQVQGQNQPLAQAHRRVAIMQGQLSPQGPRARL